MKHSGLWGVTLAAELQFNEAHGGSALPKDPESPF